MNLKNATLKGIAAFGLVTCSLVIPISGAQAASDDSTDIQNVQYFMSDERQSAPSANTYVSFGGDDKAYIKFSKEDQEGVIAGGVTALGALIGNGVGATTGAIASAVLMPYFSNGAPCAGRDDGKVSWQVWIKDSAQGPTAPGFAIDHDECVSP